MFTKLQFNALSDVKELTARLDVVRPNSNPHTMANQHITAAIKCSKFTGTTRLLLLILADAVSNGSERNDGKPNLPFGWTSKGDLQLMKALNTTRRNTVMEAMAELVGTEAKPGPVKRKRRFKKNSLTFLDLEWLLAHSYVPNVVEPERNYIIGNEDFSDDAPIPIDDSDYEGGFGDDDGGL